MPHVPNGTTDPTHKEYGYFSPYYPYTDRLSIER